MTSQLTPPEIGVTVRLYNPGFGDCILLAFRGHDKEPRYMLIDCGVHHMYSTDKCPDREERLKEVVKDIRDSTLKNLHVVAVTHEHTDHVYGFKYGRDYFDEITVHELWLPWTEDPNNATAKELKERYNKGVRAVSNAFNILKSRDQQVNQSLLLLPDFEPSFLGAHGGKADQITYLKEKSAKKLVHPEDYINPGDILYMKDVDDVRFYVLGPPTDVKWIRSLQRKSELYPEVEILDEKSAFEQAVMSFGKSVEEEDSFYKKSIPFDDKYGISTNEAENDQFFVEHYGFDGDDWRRIELDWLNTAKYLALDLNNKTNNTSLVFAVELLHSDPRKVLLFTGDAQVGSWLSWHELSWTCDESVTTVKDLFERTVLLKVGHHGSHNATLSHKGLELMISPDLVSMIPVDSKWACEGPGWKHPEPNLLQRLTEKSRGRIIRSDEIPGKDEVLVIPDGASDAEWTSFLGDLDWDSDNDLWIQFTVK